MVKAFPAKLAWEGYHLLMFAQLVVLMKELGVLPEEGPGMVDLILAGMYDMLLDSLPDDMPVTLLLTE
jgi:hypothetical protein